MHFCNILECGSILGSRSASDFDIDLDLGFYSDPVPVLLYCCRSIKKDPVPPPILILIHLKIAMDLDLALFLIWVTGSSNKFYRDPVPVLDMHFL